MSLERCLNVLLIGDYPPPYGGVSVQIQALQRRLAKSAGFSSAVLNIGASRRETIAGCIGVPNPWAFIRLLWRYARKGYVLHIVTNGHNGKSWMSAFLCSLAGLLNKRRTIVALDSGAMPDYALRSRGLVKVLIPATLRLTRKVICRNTRGRDILLRAGAREQDLEIIPAEAPESEYQCSLIPQTIESFLAAHTPVLGTVVAFRPEYGIKVLLDAVRQLATDHPRIGLVLIGSGEDAASQMLIDEVRREELAILVKDVPHQTCLKILSRLDIFARCTEYDGDAMSVREALALGVPVVASDTDHRPEGVILFKKGQIQDFLRALRFALIHLEELTDQSKSTTSCDSESSILRLYKELLDHDDRATGSSLV